MAKVFIPKDEVARTSGRSRRSVLAAAAASLVAFKSTGGFSETAAAAENHVAEGFFLLFRGSKIEEHRVFFVSSEVLAYCEITDIYDKADHGDANHSKKNHVVGKFGNVPGAGDRHKSWDVLYSEDLDSSELMKMTAKIKPIPSLGDGETYLAMSIA